MIGAELIIALKTYTSVAFCDLGYWKLCLKLVVERAPLGVATIPLPRWMQPSWC